MHIANGIVLQPIISSTNIVLVATNAPLSATPTLNAARNGGPSAMFYAFLYIGYYEETAGRREASKQYFREANRLAGEDYMGDTARVHWKALEGGKLP